MFISNLIDFLSWINECFSQLHISRNQDLCSGFIKNPYLPDNSFLQFYEVFFKKKNDVTEVTIVFDHLSWCFPKYLSLSVLQYEIKKLTNCNWFDSLLFLIGYFKSVKWNHNWTNIIPYKILCECKKDTFAEKYEKVDYKCK